MTQAEQPRALQLSEEQIAEIMELVDDFGLKSLFTISGVSGDPQHAHPAAQRVRGCLE
jgi:hypothetical protein